MVLEQGCKVQSLNPLANIPWPRLVGVKAYIYVRPNFYLNVYEIWYNFLL